MTARGAGGSRSGDRELRGGADGDGGERGGGGQRRVEGDLARRPARHGDDARVGGELAPVRGDDDAGRAGRSGRAHPDRADDRAQLDRARQGGGERLGEPLVAAGDPARLLPREQRRQLGEPPGAEPVERVRGRALQARGEELAHVGVGHGRRERRRCRRVRAVGRRRQRGRQPRAQRVRVDPRVRRELAVGIADPHAGELEPEPRRRGRPSPRSPR